MSLKIKYVPVNCWNPFSTISATDIGDGKLTPSGQF